MTAAAARRAARVRLLCLDVDGTLTDGRLWLRPDGAVERCFHVLDGHGVRRFARAGGVVAFVTAGEESAALRRRAAALGVRHVHQGCDDKLAVVKELLRAEELRPAEAAFFGDDIQDLPAMRHVGFACAPATAMPEVLAAAHYVPHRPAGGGAAREICELLLAARQ